MPRKRKTKIAKIRTWLEAGRPITPVTAFNRFGCMRLAAVVHSLRASGLTIYTDMTKGFATYRLSL